MKILDRFFSKFKQPPKIVDRAPGHINTFDIDGVIFINEKIGGIYPGPHDFIITGRSIEEVPETIEMLQDRGIINRVFFNRTKFVNKTRQGSGFHKVETIKRLEHKGYCVMCHFEDDEVQAALIRKFCPNVHVVMVVHDLTNKENVRHVRKNDQVHTTSTPTSG